MVVAVVDAAAYAGFVVGFNFTFFYHGVWWRVGECVWVGDLLERNGMGGKANGGKELGGFARSAFIHGFAVMSVVGGDWSKEMEEVVFSLLVANSVAAVLKAAVKRGGVKVRGGRGYLRIAHLIR